MYASAADMITRFGADELIQLTNRSSTSVTEAMLQTLVDGGSMSAYSADEQAATRAVLDTIDEAIEDAESEINPYLESRYTLPLSSTPRILEKLECEMARYNLHGDMVTEQVRRRYEDAIKFLKAVAGGTASIGLDESSETTTPTGGIQTSGPDRVFTDDTLSSFTS